MKLTTDKFLELLNDKGVAYTVQDRQLLLSGSDIDVIASLYELLEKNTEFEAAVIQKINVKQGISLKEYHLALESAGVKCELADLHTLNFTGGKAKTRERLIGILEDNSRLKSAVILSLAVKNPDLMDMIQERACIRWENGYSDSLLMAVLSGITATGETTKRDKNGQILLKPKTDWNVELSNLAAS